MRNLKKILALVVVFALAISMMANAVSFTDLAATKTGDANKINLVSTLGIVKGYASADGKTFEFRQDGKITRAEISTIIYRLLTGDVANATFKAKTNFPDVTEGDWFGGYVKYATALEPSVILGRTNGNFDPKADVTIAEAATMLVRALGYDKMTSLEAGVAKACELGILTTAAGADAAATRGQVADMVYNAMFNKYLRNATTGTLGNTVAPTLAYSVFKITPFDAVLTGSGNGKVDLSVIEAFDGYTFSDDWFDWLMGDGYNNFVGNPYFTKISAGYAGLDAYVGYSVRIFAKDLNGNKKLDVYDSMSFIYVSPKNVVKEGTSKDFGSQDVSNKRLDNGIFSTGGTVYKYETTPALGEPINVFENGRLIGKQWDVTKVIKNNVEVNEYGYTDDARNYLFGNITGITNPVTFPVPADIYLNNGDGKYYYDVNQTFAANSNYTLVNDHSVESYFETFMESASYATYKMIDNDGDGKFEYAWTTYTGSAILGDTTSTSYVHFGNIDNQIEKTVDWYRSSPNFTSNYDNSNSISPSKVTYNNCLPGDYVYITPTWNGSDYNYSLEKATTVTGKLTAVGFGQQGTIQIDGKTYNMANTMFLYNYRGYNGDFTVDVGPYADGFYGYDNKANLGKYFKLVMNKSGNVWRVEKYTPAVADTKGKYGIITDIAKTPINLKASDPFAVPVWVIQVKMLNENGETKIYNTNVDVDSGWNVNWAEISNDQTFLDLFAAWGEKFMKYALDADGRLIIEDIAATTQTNEYFKNGWNEYWSNTMVALNTVFDYTAATKYFVKDGFSTINGDLKYKVDDNTVIFSFTDKNGNNAKDEDEAATVIKAADLTDLNNAYIYADDTVNYSTGIKYVKAVVLMNKSTTALTTHIGWWQSTMAKTYDAEGNETSWTLKFAEYNGDKTYTTAKDVTFPSPWAYGSSTYRLFMYDVNDDGEIVAFHTIANGDFTRTPLDFAEGQYFTVQLGNSAYTDATKTTMDLDLYIDVKNPVVAGQTMTIQSNAMLTEDTRIFILKTAGNRLDDSSWYKANSSTADPFFDFNKWTGKYNNTPYDLQGAEAAYNQSGDYYQFGWAKFAFENGQLTVTELYLTDEPLGASLPQ